jgi:hypothetical protein
MSSASAFLVSRSYFDDQFRAALEKKAFDGEYTASSVIVTLSIALALWNAIELALLVATTFNRWKGLYFWSLILCNFGVILYAIGMMLMYFELCILWFSKVVLDVGWTLLIVCQSLVLYSRLNLVMDEEKILKGVKWMIIIDSVLLCTLTWVTDFGTTYTTSPGFAKGYFYIEHIQVTGFCVQELIISGLYIWAAARLLKVISTKQTRNMMWQLVAINFIIVGMDVSAFASGLAQITDIFQIALIVLQYKHLQLYQESIKVFVYSVKLKLELNILNRLVDLVHGSAASRQSKSMNLATIGAADVTSDKSHRELSRIQSNSLHLDNWLGTDEKHDSDKTSGGEYDLEPKLSPIIYNNGNDEITHVTAQSRYSKRTSGRESDVMYADFLRDMK